MFEREFRLPIWLLLAAFLSPAAASAQPADSLRARIVRLTALLEMAKQEEAEKQERIRARVDTFRAGVFTVLTKPEHVALVSEASELAWQRLWQQLGEDAHRLPGATFNYYLEPSREPDPGAASFLETAHIVQYHEQEGASELADRILGDLSARLAGYLDPADQWVLAIPLEPLDSERRKRIYIGMVTAGSRAVAACLEGDIPACRGALAVAPMADPISTWYTAAERRRLVERRVIDRRREDEIRRCVFGRSDAVCLAILRSVTPRTLRPISEDARRLMVEVAVKRGGEGAYRRLLDLRPASVEQRLIAASRLEFDSLVAVWRSAVLDSRSKSPHISRAAGWAAFAWILAIACLAARSTRWR